MKTLKAILRLLRPKQWSKNLLVLAAPIFAAVHRDPIALQATGIAFAAMCLASSATYVANDLLDAERDKLHPTKQYRPIASGQIGRTTALVLAALLAVGGIGLASLLNTSSLTIVVSYLVLQVLYNLGLKKIPIADVFTIALGFIFRAVLGAAAVSVPISGWLLFCTGALALMLGFAKRRHEFILQSEQRTASRESLGGYSKAGLDALVIMTATGGAMCYGIYTVDSSTAARYPAIVITSLFVFYGIARYVLIIFGRDEGGEPADLLFKDPQLLASVLLFMASAILAVSGLKIPLLEK
jgi:4-hydroxybenzoate polyprenyltransferase